MTEQRMQEVEQAVAAAETRLTVERAVAVIRACKELLRLVPRQERLL